MKLSIERGTLLKAVSQAQSVVERRNTIPILANVLIEAEGSTVNFRATDLDIEVLDKAPAQVERAGFHNGICGDAARDRSQTAGWIACHPVG
jgi:DNA polymerase III subunit beta